MPRWRHLTLCTPSGVLASNSLPHPGACPPLRRVSLQGSMHGAEDVAKVLDMVQRQRLEHRKLQRLMLDTSGRNQATAQQQLEDVRAQQQGSAASMQVDAQQGTTASMEVEVAREQGPRAGRDVDMSDVVHKQNGGVPEAQRQGLLQNGGVLGAAAQGQGQGRGQRRASRESVGPPVPGAEAGVGAGADSGPRPGSGSELAMMTAGLDSPTTSSSSRGADPFGSVATPGTHSASKSKLGFLSQVCHAWFRSATVSPT